MKNILIFFGFVLLLSASVVAPAVLIKNRSKEQVVLYSTDVKSLSDSIKQLFKRGYRVMFMESQSVSTSVNSRTNTSNSYDWPHRDVKGQVIVIMEK